MNPPGSFRRSAFPHGPSPSLGPRSESHPLNHLDLRIYCTPDRSFGSLAYARSPKEPRRLIKLGLRLFVCMRFQDLFHSPSGVLFAFPSRYWFAIGRSRVFSLGGWSPHLRTGLHVSRPTCRTLSSTSDFSRTGLSPTAAALSRAFHYVES